MNVLNFALIGGLLLLAGCETTSSIPYEVSTGNIMEMRANVELGNTVRVEEFDIANGVNQNPMCRLMGPVKVSPGKTMMQFIKDAFEKELYEAGLLDLKSPVVIKGRLEKIEFSSVSPAWWDLTLRLQSSNGSTLTVTNNYGFATSFSAYGACKNVADAFGPAVQVLLGMAIENPDFPSLFARNDSLTYPAKTEESFYDEAEQETNSGKIDKNLWARALVEAEGDETKRKAKYIELRAVQLFSDSGGSVASIAPSNQGNSEKNIPIFDVSGNYQSKITTNSNWQFLKRYKDLKITITQSGSKIQAIDNRYQTKIEGTLEGNVIKFHVNPNVVSGFYDAEGEWKLRDDRTGFEGNWRSLGGADAGSGTWNLKKLD